MAEDIVAKAPTDWTEAVFNSAAGQWGASMTGHYIVEGGERAWGRFQCFDEVRAVAEATRKALGWEATSIEVRCRPSGEYELVACPGAVTHRRGLFDGFQAVLEPDYRLPQPGREQERGSAAPDGDAELAVERFRAYLDRRAAILGRPDQLPPPVPVEALEEAERRIGRALPADLRALYLIADGEGPDYADRSYLFGGDTWLPLATLVGEYEAHREPVWFGWDLAEDAVVFDAVPHHTVRRCSAHPDWIPFATGEDGNYLAVDLTPARDGRPGQVIHIGRDYNHGPAFMAESITALLGRYLDLLDQGAYAVDGDYLALREPGTRLGTERVVGGEIPADVSPTLQAIHINDATSPVDLTRLSAAPSLRMLHLNRCATADLTPVRQLPVESLRVTLDGGDLAPLAHHRTLTALRLGSTVPVDISPLRTLPKLRLLDLSEAEVLDLSPLADLPELRCLSLSTQQWALVLEQGHVPATLAAVRLADGSASLSQALAWARQLGQDNPDTVCLAGSLATEGA